jgi:hypothetical protein
MFMKHFRDAIRSGEWRAMAAAFLVIAILVTL